MAPKFKVGQPVYVTPREVTTGPLGALTGVSSSSPHMAE